MTRHPHVFVAIYEGDLITDARIVAASADPELCRHAAAVMLSESQNGEAANRVRSALSVGREDALRLISTESQEAS